MRAVVIHAPKDLRIDSYPDAAPGPGEVSLYLRACRGNDLVIALPGGRRGPPLTTARAIP